MYSYDVDSSGLYALFAGLGVFMIIIFLAILALAIVCIVAQWKLFKKAGKKGWEAVVPFYSTWILIEIAGLNWWYFLIAVAGTIISLLGIEGLGWLTTIAGYFVNFLVFYNIARKTRQNEILYGILGIFVSFVPVLILGFSKNITYESSIEVSPNGPIGAPKNNANNNAPERYCLGCGQKLDGNVQYCQHCGKKVED